jgi:hypothetical protein
VIERDQLRASLADRYTVERELGGGVSRSIGYFQRAIDRDSTFGRAWAELSLAYCVLPLFSPVPVDSSVALARRAMIQAKRLDPASASAYAAEGFTELFASNFGYLLAATGDRAGASAFLREMESQRGRNGFANLTVAWTALGTRATARALDAHERAQQAREPIGFTVPFGMPAYDAVRGSARFAAVVNGYGLDPAQYVSRH